MFFDTTGSKSALRSYPVTDVPAAIPREPCLKTADPAVGTRVDHLPPAAWDALVASFDDGLYDQLHSYARGAWRSSELSHLTVSRHGRVVGAAQAVLLRPPGLQRGVAYVKFGPLWRRRGETPGGDLLECVLRALALEYAGRRQMHLTVLPPPEPELASRVTEAFDATGFCRHRAMPDPNRYLVNLSLSRDEQHRSLSQKWRYNLRKAEAHAIDVGVDETPEALAVFKSLYGGMVARKRFRDRAGHRLLDGLFERPRAGPQPVIVLARYGGEAVAGAVIGRLGATASYLFGATNARALELRAGYAQHWWITDRLSRSGARWYDLGGEGASDGLRQFKKGLVGKAGQVLELPGEFDYCGDSTSKFIATMIYRARDLRRACLSIADYKLQRKAL